jgi:3-oxoacyl-[acyl-carrier-protein] synthase II
MGGKGVYFINGVGIISPQKTFDPQVFLTDISEYDTNVLRCVTPEFKAYINPIQMRRLSRMLRIGLSAATICLRDSRVPVPDGIITATGYGFLDETYKFLKEILEQSEKQLTPTYFMQSTVNALAGLVALTIKCMGYNNAYASKGFAFENALLDAMMQLNDNASANILVGSYDEAAEVQYKASIRSGHFKVEHLNSLSLFTAGTKGTIQGEGAAFFMLSGNASPSTWCTLLDMQMVYRPDADELSSGLTDFLNSNNMSPSDIDVVINGASGDVDHDTATGTLIKTHLSKSLEARFKHLCGEYTTSTSFAVWLAASILQRQEVPGPVRFNQVELSRKLHTVLIINQYMAKSFTFILMAVK